MKCGLNNFIIGILICLGEFDKLLATPRAVIERSQVRCDAFPNEDRPKVYTYVVSPPRLIENGF
jgi:hypothetical protein